MTTATRQLSLVLLIYLALATAHSVIVPLTFGNDEWMHFRYIRFISDHGRLPTTLTERDQTGYKADSPPLYHLMVAALTSPISPHPPLRLAETPRNQLADNIIVTDTPLFYTTDQTWPYRGEVLIWHVGRAISIFFGLTLIILTYLTALEVGLAHRPALTAATFIAFTPAIIFHSSVLSYETFSATLTALLLLLALKLLRPNSSYQHPLTWIGLGVLAGLAIITKYSALLLPLELIFIAWLSQMRNKKLEIRNFPPLTSHLSPLTSYFLLLIGLLLAVSGWFGFIIWHFNTIATQGPIAGIIEPIFVGDASDTTSVQVATLMFSDTSATARPPKPRDYLALTQAFINSFWSAPIMGHYIPYLPLIATVIIIVSITIKFSPLTSHLSPPTSQFALLLFHSLLITPLLVIRILFSYDALEAAQGRHILMPAASAIAILMTNYGCKIKNFPTPYSLLPTPYPLLAFLLTWSVWGQIGWAIIAYPPPLTVTNNPDLAPGQGQVLAQAMQLNQATWQIHSDTLQVTLSWQALAPMSQDYLIQLQLRDSTNQLVSQISGQPIQGRYPTRAWEVGDTVTDVYHLPLLGQLQGDYNLQLQLLQRTGQAENASLSLGTVSLNLTAPPANPCERYTQAEPVRRSLSEVAYRPFATLTMFSPEPPRLIASDKTQQTPIISVNHWHTFMVEPNWYNSYRLMVGLTDCGLVQFDIPPRPFIPPLIPTPLVVNFNNEIELLGYELPTRRINAGERLPVTLYWRSLAYVGHDYQIFDNLLDQNQQRWGGYDRLPRDNYSTLLWSPGEVITDAFGVSIDPAAPNGIYTLDVGLYQQTLSGAVSLPVMVDGQTTSQNSLRLGPIKVGGAPETVITPQATPQTTLNQPFADSITLLGYDLIMTNTMQLTLYWQAIGRPTADYTTFVHLRDQANHNVAQQDGPPGQNRYPTSLWDKGEVIAQPITLDNITSGRYPLVIGLYDSITGNRLSMDGMTNNELHLKEVTVK